MGGSLQAQWVCPCVCPREETVAVAVTAVESSERRCRASNSIRPSSTHIHDSLTASVLLHIPLSLYP